MYVANNQLITTVRIQQTIIDNEHEYGYGL